MLMKKWLLGLLSVLSLCACSNEWDEQQVIKEQYPPVQQERGIRGDIRNYIASTKFGSLQTRAANDHVLTPYVYKGDTVMYIVNYGQGWDIFSNDYRAPMVLFSSDTGSFDMDDENMAPALKEYILSTADELSQLQQSEAVPDTVCGLWQTVMLRNEEVDPQQVQVSASRSGGVIPGENGEWVLAERYVSNSSTSTTPKLTSTAWGQGIPWNVFIPYAQDNSSVKGPAGCESVAVAQYLYYLHYATGAPANVVTTATYNAASNTYTYSGWSSLAWNQMATDYMGSIAATNYVATLIGYVGKCMNTKYTAEAGTAYFADAISLINQQAGTNYYSANIDYAYVNDELDAGRPVYARAATYVQGNERPVGHAFIIDRKQYTMTTTVSRYGWVGEDKTMGMILMIVMMTGI